VWCAKEDAGERGEGKADASVRADGRRCAVLLCLQFW